MIEISNTEEALAWGDSWEECARDRLREIVRLQQEMFWIGHRADVNFFTAELLRAQLKAAGITPMDEDKWSD